MSMKSTLYKVTPGSALGIILRRAKRAYKRADVPFDAKYAEKALRRCHAVHPLRLSDMARGLTVHLVHDVDGIMNRFDMVDGTFRDFWTPRYGVQR